MNGLKPHFLLICETEQSDSRHAWRFALRSEDGTQGLDASDSQCPVSGERLELLAVVRGLEALDQPSVVTLVNPSKYVQRGLRYGLGEWRESDWRWERFGMLVPVKNCDLWQRLDRALAYHTVRSRILRFDSEHEPARTPQPRIMERLTRALEACFPTPQPALAS